MSTVTNTKRVRHHVADEVVLTPPAASPRRWKWIAVLVVLLGFVWLLPGLVAHSPLLNWAIRAGTGKLDGNVAIGSASLGWFSPVGLSRLELRDTKGELVVQADEIKSEKSLWRLLANLSSLGKFRLEKPSLALVLRSDGSNLEDVLAKYLSANDSGQKSVGLDLEVNEGTVSITDQQSHRTWQIEKLQVTASMAADPAEPLRLEGSATVADPNRPGSVQAKLNLKMPQSAVPATSAAVDAPAKPATPQLGLGNTAGDVNVQAEGVPLAMFERLAARFLPGTQLDGRLSAKIDAKWDDQVAGTLAVQADAGTSGLLFSAAALGKDQLRLERLATKCLIKYQDHRLDVEPSSLECDLGNLTAAGSLALPEARGQGLPGMLAEQIGATVGGFLTSAPPGTASPKSLAQQTVEVTGRLDLARLAKMLPGTLRVREGTEIVSGQVQIGLVSRRAAINDPAVAGAASPAANAAMGMVWQAQLEAGNLVASDRGRQLVWERPIRLTLAAHETPQGPTVDRLQCESDFLKFNVAGTPDNLAASVSCNLKQLVDQLGQFFDTSGMTLAGEGWGQFHWVRGADQQFETDGELQLRNFQLALPQRPAWSEDGLVMVMAAKGRTNLGVDTRLESAVIQIKAGRDQLDAKLIQPVLDLRGGGSWPLDVQAQGPLGGWSSRLAMFAALDTWRLAGNYQLTGQVTASKDSIALRQVRLAMTQFSVAGPGVNINEPTAELTATGRWELPQQRWQIENLGLNSSSAAVQGKDLVVTMPSNGPWEMTGGVGYRGDLARIRAWFAEPGKPAAWQIAGQVTGSAQLQQAGGTIKGTTEADVMNLAVAASSGEQFQERQIHLTAQGSYQPQAAMLRLESLLLTSNILGAKAAGQVTQRRTAQDSGSAEISGELSYDCEKLCTLARPYLGPWVKITGRGTSPAWYRGPLGMVGAQAAAGLKWDSANLAGFKIGTGELKLALADGTLKAEPLHVACNQGKLHLAPAVRLGPGAMELSMPAGPLAENVQIDPTMCEAALKYIAPVLAGVATAKGTFSIQMEGCRIPVSDPAKGEMAGKFVIHSVEVGAGPLVRELAVLLSRTGTAKLQRESVVPFRMVGGRVYHQGLTLEFPDLTIRTYGSVGLDRTLAMMAEMPIPPKWIGNNPLGDAMKGQTIRLPINGTLNQPQLDKAEMAKINRQFFGSAAKNVLQGEVGKQLDRWLGPGR